MAGNLSEFPNRLHWKFLSLKMFLSKKCVHLFYVSFQVVLATVVLEYYFWLQNFSAVMFGCK